MRSSGDKRVTTVRLSPETKALLENASRIRKTSESSLIEDAIQDFCKKHGLNTRYVMHASVDCYALVKHAGDTAVIIEQHALNGTSIDDVRHSYEAKFNSPVELLLDKGVIQ